jgi:hypothetical protein
MAPEKPDVPLVPLAPEVPDNPEAVKAPANPLKPLKPEVPDSPEAPCSPRETVVLTCPPSNVVEIGLFITVVTKSPMTLLHSTSNELQVRLDFLDVFPVGRHLGLQLGQPGAMTYRLRQVPSPNANKSGTNQRKHGLEEVAGTRGDDGVR